MAYNNTVDTITLEDIVPVVVDTVLRSNVFATKMLSKTKKFRADTQDFPKHIVSPYLAIVSVGILMGK